MKFDPKFIIRVAGTLTAIALVTAALLGLVNKVTAPNILAINKEKTEKAMSEVVTDPASEFSDALEVTQEYKDAAAAYGTIAELYEVSRKFRSEPLSDTQVTVYEGKQLSYVSLPASIFTHCS